MIFSIFKSKLVFGAKFENHGDIYNSGTLSVINALGKLILNEGLIECENGAVCNFTD